MKTKLFLSLLLMAGSAFSQEQVVTPAPLPSVAPDLAYSTMCDTRNELVTLSFVGDILVHQALYRAVVAGTQNFAQIWSRTDGLIKKADFSVGNLEGPAALGIDRRGRDRGDIGFVYDNDVYSGTNFVFNYHPRILSDLKNSGYDLLTTANNHSLDRRSIGIDKTLAAAEDIGLPTVGTRASQERNGVFYKIIPVKNMKVAFVGCTEMTNGMPDPNEQVLMCYKNPERILGLIQEVSARSDVDALIVMPHWGVEYKHIPEAQQKTFAKKYLEAGATAVIGSHPHVLQPWQKHITKDGRETFIVYSLGNFVAGQDGLPKQTGAVAYLGLSKEGTQKAKIVGVGYTPTYRQGTEIFPVGKTDSNEVLNHAAQLFGAKGRIEPTADLLPFLCSGPRSPKSN